MFLFSFTKKPVNKTVDDSHDIGSHGKVKNLKIRRDASMLFYIKRFKKCKAKSAVLLGEFLGTSIS